MRTYAAIGMFLLITCPAFAKKHPGFETKPKFKPSAQSDIIDGCISVTKIRSTRYGWGGPGGKNSYTQGFYVTSCYIRHHTDFESCEYAVTGSGITACFHVVGFGLNL